MKKTVKTLVLLGLALVLTFGNSAFAVDVLQAGSIEPDYKDIVEDIFPGYWDEHVSPQWSSGDKDVANPGTHGYITQVAYNLIRDDNSAAYNFYSGQKTNLIRGSILPDVDETSSGLFIWHFYGENGKSFNGSSTTAYTKCIEHYNQAVNLYRLGSKSSAMEELGRALHYLQDVNVPHHAMNAIAVITNHTQFEAYVEANQESFGVAGLTPSIYTDADDSLGIIIDDRAEVARGWYDEATSSSASERNNAAGACVRNSQRATVTVLYKFMLDVGFLVEVR